MRDHPLRQIGRHFDTALLGQTIEFGLSQVARQITDAVNEPPGQACRDVFADVEFGHRHVARNDDARFGMASDGIHQMKKLFQVFGIELLNVIDRINGDVFVKFGNAPALARGHGTQQMGFAATARPPQVDELGAVARQTVFQGSDDFPVLAADKIIQRRAFGLDQIQ